MCKSLSGLLITATRYGVITMGWVRFWKFAVGWVGFTKWWVGLGQVSKSGPMFTSEYNNLVWLRPTLGQRNKSIRNKGIHLLNLAALNAHLITLNTPFIDRLTPYLVISAGLLLKKLLFIWLRQNVYPYSFMACTEPCPLNYYDMNWFDLAINQFLTKLSRPKTNNIKIIEDCRNNFGVTLLSSSITCSTKEFIAKCMLLENSIRERRSGWMQWQVDNISTKLLIHRCCWWIKSYNPIES